MPTLEPPKGSLQGVLVVIPKPGNPHHVWRRAGGGEDVAQRQDRGGVDGEAGSRRGAVIEGEGHGWAGEKLKDSIEKMTAFLDANLKKK